MVNDMKEELVSQKKCLKLPNTLIIKFLNLQLCQSLPLARSGLQNQTFILWNSRSKGEETTEQVIITIKEPQTTPKQINKQPNKTPKKEHPKTTTKGKQKKHLTWTRFPLAPLIPSVQGLDLTKAVKDKQRKEVSWLLRYISLKIASTNIYFFFCTTETSQMEFFNSLTLNLAKHAYDNLELYYDDKMCSLHNSFGDIMAQPLLPLESSLSRETDHMYTSRSNFL